MKRVGYIEQQVYELLDGVSVPRHKGKKPTKTIQSKYICVNVLQTPVDTYQNTYCNVNCHVKDLGDGVKDSVSLEALASEVQELLKKVRIIGEVSFIMDFHSSEIIPEEKLGEHFYNLKFKVTIANN